MTNDPRRAPFGDESVFERHRRALESVCKIAGTKRDGCQVAPVEASLFDGARERGVSLARRREGDDARRSEIEPLVHAEVPFASLHAEPFSKPRDEIPAEGFV